MIKFKQLQFKNFFSYSNQLTTIDFENGMYLITGKNGSGKSVILDAIFYCLYGKSLRPDIKNSEIINRINKKNMYVKLTFDINNIEYSIIRGLKPTIFQIWKNNEKLEEYNKKDMQKYVEDDILKLNDKIFKQIVILGSDLHTPFLKLSLPDRRFLIEKLFDFDVLKKIKENAKEDYKEKDKKLSELNNKSNIVITKIESLKDEKSRIEKENERIKESRDKEIEKINNEVKEKKLEIKNLENEIDKSINKKQLEDYEEKSYDIAIELNNLNDNLNNKILNLNKKFNDRQIELSNKIVELKNDIEKLNREIKNKQDIINGSKLIEDERYKKEQEILRTNQTGFDKIDLYKKDDFENIKIKIHDIETNIEKLMKRMGYYQKNDSCEVCGNIFTKEKKKDVIGEIKNDIRYYNKEKNEYDEQLKKLNEDKKEVIKKLNESIIKSKDKIKKILNDVKVQIEKEIEELKKKREGIGLKSLEKDKEMESLQNKKRKLEKEIRDEHEIEYDKLLEEKNKIIKEKREYEKKLQEQEELKNNIKIHCIQIGNLNERMKVQNNIKLLPTKEIDGRLLKLRKLYKKINKEVSKVERYLEYIEKIIDMFSDKGIRSVLIQKYLSLLNNELYNFLNEFNCDFNIEFDHNFDTVIKNRDKEISYGTYSSGQRQRMNLAILFTFMSFMKLKQGINCNLLIFDEILDSSLDEDGIEIFFRLLERFSVKEKYCIPVISHRESNINYFSNVYKVEMKNKFSNIERIVI